MAGLFVFLFVFFVTFVVNDYAIFFTTKNTKVTKDHATLSSMSP